MRFRTEEERKGCKSIRDLIPDLVAEMNLESPFFVGEIQEQWEQIVGSILFTHSYPLKKTGSVLYIEADHPVFANDITMMKKMIMEKIKNLCGEKGVLDIKVLVKKTSVKRSPK
jgi:predicted nucleic acid-binding Zn ribbon protein